LPRLGNADRVLRVVGAAAGPLRKPALASCRSLTIPWLAHARNPDTLVKGTRSVRDVRVALAAGHHYSHYVAWGPHYRLGVTFGFHLPQQMRAELCASESPKIFRNFNYELDI